MPEKPDFSAFIRELRTALRERIAADWSAYRNGLTDLADTFLRESREDLARWTGLLSVGAITREDFRWLVEARKDLARVEALERVGLSLAQIDRLRAAVAETVVGTAFRVFV